MQRFLWSVVAVATLASPAGADARRAPRRMRVEALRLLKRTQPVKSVTDVLADLGDGRFPVLFFTRGRECLSRDNCSPTTLPHVALVARDAAGALTLEGSLDLPTATTPWDNVEEIGWGITFVKDYDGDGKPELLVLYGYHGPTEPAVGDTAYRDICIVNLDKPSLALHVTLDETPQAVVLTRVQTKWKLAKDGSVPVFRLERKSSDYDLDKQERVDKAERLTYRYDAATDRWLMVAPAGEK